MVFGHHALAPGPGTGGDYPQLPLDRMRFERFQAPSPAGSYDWRQFEFLERPSSFRGNPFAPGTKGRDLLLPLKGLHEGIVKGLGLLLFFG